MPTKGYSSLNQANNAASVRRKKSEEAEFRSQDASDANETSASTRKSRRVSTRKSASPARDSISDAVYIPTSDDELECEECGRIYKGDCPVHGPLVAINDIPIPPEFEDFTRALRTAPPVVSVRQSEIPGAGKGVYANTLIPRRIRFGPFEGERRPLRKHASGYRWEILKNGKAFEEVDGSKPGLSNWMRYINCGPNKGANNLEAFQFNGNIYYRTIRPIIPGEELLVCYGEPYNEHLGIRDD